MKIKYNTERAIEVFRLLDKLWKDGNGIFKDVVLSQNRWPEPKQKKELANYLFCAAIFMRGARNSDDPFRWLSKLWQKVPEMFDPESVAKEWTMRRIQHTIREITPEILQKKKEEDNGDNGAGALGYNLRESTRFWHKNLTVLHKEWGGDIFNAFWGVTEFEGFYRRVNYEDNEAGFEGMKRKIFSLFVIWLQERGLIPILPTPLPIDHHALRILTATGIVKFIDPNVPVTLEKYYPALIGQFAVRVYDKKVNDPIAIWSQKLLKKHNISHLTVNPAMWVVSRDFCSNQLQNTTRQNGQFFFTPELLKQNPKLWPKRYKNPCRYCPLESFCTGVLPSHPYHKRGTMVIMQRVPYAEPYLPGVDWKEVMPYTGRRRSLSKNH